MGFDYKLLGFKCGIEAHQQLEGKKLFCNCPTEIRRDPSHFTIRRTLRAAAGESGAIDVAAKHEQAKGKAFIYQGYYDTTCLVELDDEPVHAVNPDALKIVLQVAHLLNCKVVDEIQFMRKIVVDGSNVSGFQRTALVGRNGWVEINGRKIGISSVCLEEEACQAVTRTEKEDTYNLSRLGIPLVEIATDASIASPEECKEVAAKLGMILRSVDGMKRGIGSIRQDVNVSIKGGARTEIKGFQEYKSIPKVIEEEIKRQQKLIKQGKKIVQEVRKAEQNFSTSFLRPMPGAARMYPETDVRPSKPGATAVGKIELLEEKAEKLKILGIGADLANATVKLGRADFVLSLAAQYSSVKPAFIAETLISTPGTIKRKENVDCNPRDADWHTLFAALAQGKIAKDAICPILLDFGRTGKMEFTKYALLSDKELEIAIKKIIAENKSIPPNALIGKVMGQLRGKADGQKIIEKLKAFAQ
ncbi:MAG TPA: Glu-tRNA(Gln) amidotransferase subunit GatE [Candidatus Nanoarchaeia archaeon]|nr:Glu-tRNA(Gln) amidotransferase subunit GatE [Candidatus Nanoarchaeia archaeon]